MPEHLGGTSIIHRGGPDGQDDMLWVQSAVIEQGLMLLHSSVKWDIIVFAPSTKRVQEKNWVFVSEFQ